MTAEETAKLLQERFDETDAALYQLHRAMLICGAWTLDRYDQAQLDLAHSRIDVAEAFAIEPRHP